MPTKRCLSDAVWAQETDGVLYFVMQRQEHVKICIWIIIIFPYPVYRRTKCRISQPFFWHIKLKFSILVDLDVFCNIYSGFYERRNILGNKIPFFFENLTILTWSWPDFYYKLLNIASHDLINIEFLDQSWSGNMWRMTYLWLQHSRDLLWPSFDLQVYKVQYTNSTFSLYLRVVWPKSSPF